LDLYVRLKVPSLIAVLFNLVWNCVLNSVPFYTATSNVWGFKFHPHQFFFFFLLVGQGFELRVLCLLGRRPINFKHRSRDSGTVHLFVLITQLQLTLGNHLLHFVIACFSFSTKPLYTKTYQFNVYYWFNRCTEPVPLSVLILYIFLSSTPTLAGSESLRASP
jgi:hypothetical protein